MIIGLIPLALALSTPPVTIHPHHHQEAPMAASHGNPGQGGGSNRTNKGRAGELQPRLSYPNRHPNQPGPRSYAGPNRIGMDASNPTLPTEHTNRPRPLHVR